MKNRLFTIILIFIEINAYSQIRYADKEQAAPTKSKEAMDSYNNGYKSFMKENYKDAIKFYKQAISFDHLFIDAFDNLALTFRRMDKLDSAEYYYLKSLSILPSNLMALNNLALVYTNKGQLDKSSETYNKILAVDSLCADGYFGLAEIKFRQKDYDAAIINGLRAFKLWEKSNRLYAGDAMQYVGIAQLSKGDKKAARISFQKSKQLGTRVPDEYIDACNK